MVSHLNDLNSRMRAFGYSGSLEQKEFDAWLEERPARGLEWKQFCGELDQGPRQSPFDPREMNTPWVNSPFFGRMLAQKALPDEDAALVRAFHEDGLIKINLRDSICDGTAEQVIKDLADKYIDPVRIQDAWQQNAKVKEIALLPKVLRTLELLYGREVVPFQTINFRVGTQQAGHTDTIHFDSMPQRFMCGVWVGLEDIGANNGPLFYYPGSQLLPVYDFFDIGLEGSLKEAEFSPRYAVYVDFLDQLMEAHGLERQMLQIEKGEAVIWSANVIHGGSPILDPGSSRHSQVTHYYFKGCSYFTPLQSNWHTGDVRFRDIVNIQTGELVPNRYLIHKAVEAAPPSPAPVGKRRALKVLLGLDQ